MKTAGHASHVVRVFRHFGDAVQQIADQRMHALETLLRAPALLADVQNLLLGLVQNRGDGFALRVEGVGGDFVRSGHQLAQNRAFTHDFGVAADVARARHVLGQRVQVAQAADFLGLAQALQPLIDGDDVGGFGAIDQHANGGINQLVFVAVKILVGEQVADPVPSRVVEQQATQHAGLAFNRMRRNAQLGNLAVSAVARWIKSGK